MRDNRLEPVYAILNSHCLDAVALVPGPNFRRIFGRDFHLMERPLIVIVPVSGEPVAVVPAIELSSFAALKFPGPVFDWQDETGYMEAFRSAASALRQLKSADRFGLEAQRMRAFEHMTLANVFPDAGFVDAHAEIENYDRIGYRTLTCSAKKGRNVEQIVDELRANTSIIVGQSGVGKSSIINRLTDSSALPVGDISECSGEGRHTTVNSVMLS